MPHSVDNIPNDVDEYTASVEAKLYMEACSGGDALKNFEDKCLRFFSVNSDDSNVVDFQHDILTPPPKECKPHSRNAFENEFRDVYQSNWYKVFLCPMVCQ